MTDITEYPTREGGLRPHPRKVIGWSIDSTQTAALPTNALLRAITNRNPDCGTVLQSDYGSQFTS